MPDTTTRDALARNIAARVGMCSEAELRALDVELLALERRRAEGRLLHNQAVLRDADARDLRRFEHEHDFGTIEAGE